MRNLLVVSVFAVLSCTSARKQGTISIENNSGEFIDSIAINANGVFFKFYKVPGEATVETVVRSGEIKGGHHIEMIPTIYSGGKAIQCMYLYNDLGGFRGNYKMTISKEFNVKWSWKTDG